MKIAPLLLGAALLAAGPALAAPAEMASVLHADKPYGEGSVSALFMKAYTAQLWTDAQPWSMAKPFALKLTYGMGFSTEDLVSRTKSEMKHVAPGLSDATVAGYGTALDKVFPDVKSGDSITALYQPGKPVMFYKNGTATGTIAASGFAKPFFGIWLSPKTSDPDLRNQLLAQKG